MLELKEKLKIITIDQKYMKMLYSKCNQVFYLPKDYGKKPYIGILISENEREYAIPLTSAKEKHKFLKNCDNGRMLVLEYASHEKIMKNGIFKEYPNGELKHILAVLMINKMIPIKKGVYSLVNINYCHEDDLETNKYKTLLNKEYSFCVSHKEKILKIANRIYTLQIEKGIVYKGHCDFKKLEKVCDSYKVNL